jgi:ABC-type transport system involved in cytochrome bd biosynthesis fused ATPase/permease subunit
VTYIALYTDYTNTLLLLLLSLIHYCDLYCLVYTDEATSALDTRTEQGVQVALQGLKRHRTTVTIAHRLSTIRNAEQIIVLSEGQVLACMQPLLSY